LTYLPFLLTGDPYYLEETQFVASYFLFRSPPKYRISLSGRYLAWPLRSCGQALIATPEVVPSWLKPRIYFRRMLDQYRTAIEGRMAQSSDPWVSVFRVLPDFGQDEPFIPAGAGDHVWQDAFISLVMAWLVAVGREEWRAAAE